MQNAIIHRQIPRIDAALLASLCGLAVADLHDALCPAQRSVGLLGEAVRAITPGARIYGQAVTAFCAPGDSLMAHCALYFARPGDVLVISNGGVPTGALWGGNVAFEAKTLGLAGTVVDAPVRDVAFIRELQYPLWASSVSVSRCEKHGRGYVNMPVPCGRGIVSPGDIVVADDDGVLVFPPQYIPAVVQKAGEKMRQEAAVRGRVAQGERIFEMQQFGRLLEAGEVCIHDGLWTDK